MFDLTLCILLRDMRDFHPITIVLIIIIAIVFLSGCCVPSVNKRMLDSELFNGYAHSWNNGGNFFRGDYKAPRWTPEQLNPRIGTRGYRAPLSPFQYKNMKKNAWSIDF